MLQILNPFRAGQEFQKLKSKKKWILALAIVFVPVVLSMVGDTLVQQKNQEVRQQLMEEMEERGTPSETRPRAGGAARGPMGIFRGLFQGGGGMGALQGFTWLTIVLGFLSATVFWVLKSGVFHGISRVLGGEKVNLSSTIHMMAYTYIPFIFKGVLDVLEGLTYQAPSVEEFMFQPRDSMFLNFVRENFHLFVLWALFLMVIAVREQYNLGNKKAVLVVLVPYIAVWVIQVAMMSFGGLLGGVI